MHSSGHRANVCSVQSIVHKQRQWTNKDHDVVICIHVVARLTIWVFYEQFCVAPVVISNLSNLFLLPMLCMKNKEEFRKEIPMES